MADTFNSGKHDFGVTYSGTVYGMMLVQKEGVPQWAEYDDEYLATQFFTGEPSAVNLPPEREISFVRSDRRSGFGEDVYDSSDTKRYFSSIGCDLRHKGRALLSNEATAIATLPSTSAKTISNNSFESWDNGNCDNWTLVTATLTKKTAAPDPNHGTNYIQLATAGGYVWQNLSTTEIQGRRFTFTAYANTDTADKGRIAINDGFTTTYSAYHTGGSTWETLSVTVTLAKNATRLRIMCEIKDAQYCYFDGLMTCTRATYTNPTAHCFFNDIQYVAFGGLLTKEDSNGDEFEAVYEFASPITSMQVFADGFMYIAQEATQVIEDCEDAWTAGDAKTTSTLDTGDFKVGSGSAKLVYDGAGANGQLIAYEAITLNATAFTGVKLWIKADIAVAANDLKLFLSDTNDGSSVDDDMLLPALVAGQWTRVFVRQTDPASNKAILSIGLEYTANEKANTFHIDDIKAESSYWYMDSGENFTQSTLSVATHDSFAKSFQPVGLTMWKHLPPHKLYSATDPSNTGGANWSGVTNVDTSTYNITGLASDGSSLYIGKEDRAFYLDGSGNVQILIGVTSSIASSTSGKNMFVWQGKVYYPCGTQSLVEYDGGAITWRSPSKYSTNLATFNGQIQALAGDEEYLFAIIDNDTDSTVEILAGRSEIIDGSTKWVWHPLQRITLTACELAFVVNDYQKRLYIGSTNVANSFYSIPLPVGYGDIVNDANIKVPTTGTHYFEEPKIDLNFRGDDKSFIKITAELEHSWDSLIYWECWAKIEDGSYVDVGDLKGSASTRIATLYFATDTTGRNMRLKFVGKTDASSKTPILLWYDVRAILYAPKRKYFVAQIRCADNILDQDGGTMSTTAANISTYLDAARDATWPVSIRDPWGVTKTVKFLGSKSTPAFAISKAFKGENKEKTYFLLMEEAGA